MALRSWWQALAVSKTVEATAADDSSETEFVLWDLNLGWKLKIKQIPLEDGRSATKRGTAFGLRIPCGIQTGNITDSLVDTTYRSAHERKVNFEKNMEVGTVSKAEMRLQTICCWQERWNQEYSGMWTARFRLLDRHGEVNYYVIQFLLGN